MIRERDLWRLTHPDFPGHAFVGPLARCEGYRDGDRLCRPPETYVIEREPCCHCCGEDHEFRRATIVVYGNGQVRCAKHADRNPCAIEGCQRTTAAKGQAADDQWLCSEHWRRYVPPRSRTRRAYHAFFRRAKRYGWTPKLERQWWRFWDMLVRRARRRAADGFVDQAEIDRIMGW